MLCSSVLPLFSRRSTPSLTARSWYFIKIPKTGADTTGRIIANEPKPQRQLTLNRKPSAALGPAKAVIMYGDEVKAKARPRFLRLVTSAARTQMV